MTPDNPIDAATELIAKASIIIQARSAAPSRADVLRLSLEVVRLNEMVNDLAKEHRPRVACDLN